MTDPEQWSIVIGRVRTPHGLHGALKVKPLCDDAERFGLLGEVCIAFADGTRELHQLETVAYDRQEPRIQLKGVTDRTAADRFRHALVLIRPEMRVELPEDAYYVDDLKGLRVVTTEGLELGTIQDVLLLPGNDVYVTEHAMIPAVREVVRSVDIEGGVVTVEPLAGLAPELGL